jgi:glycerol-3-phosphate dehydrogenase
VNRAEGLARLGEPYDLLVVGGGATGLGIAVDSASRGYRTLLVEGADFAQGTSSRSTKLAHGGVRYLQQGNVSLVREALHERGNLLRNAPHLVHELRFLLPVYRAWDLAYYGAGLKTYDLLAGRLRLSSALLLGPKAARRLSPQLEVDRLRGGILYSDAQFDDARLALALARTAACQGATLVTHTPVVALTKARGRIAGAVVRDAITGEEYTVRARCVVNATGIFGDVVRRLDDPLVPGMLTVSQGAHLVLGPKALDSPTAVLIPRTDDRRVIFIIPWHDRTLLGTTETPMSAPELEPMSLDEEIDYLLEHAGRYLRRAPQRSDVLSTFAGLRPLVDGGGRATAALSRDHQIVVSGSGLVSIMGGKWTTYRRMAQDTVDRAVQVAGLPSRPCVTAALPLDGADAAPGPWAEFGLDAGSIAEYERAFDPTPFPGLPYSLAMAAATIDLEMPVHLDDVLSRRLRALLLDADATVRAAPAVAALMARLQGHDEAWERDEVARFAHLAEGYRVQGQSIAPSSLSDSLHR